jgi:hypothetical protein
MNVDNLSSIKQLLFAGFGKTASHTAAQTKNLTSTDQTSFATLLSNARKVLPRGAGNGATPNLLEDVMAAADPQKVENAQSALLSSGGGTSVAAGQLDSKGKAMMALEGTLMTKFVDQMLPKSNHALYGSGIAGDTSRGFEVDQFGAALAKSDPLKFAPTQSGIKLTASAGVTNLFGSGLDDRQPSQPISPFSS